MRGEGYSYLGYVGYDVAVRTICAVFGGTLYRTTGGCRRRRRIRRGGQPGVNSLAAKNQLRLRSFQCFLIIQ